MVNAEKGLLPQAANGPSFFPAEFEWETKKVRPVVIAGLVDILGAIRNTVQASGNLTALTPVDPPVPIIPAATVLTVSGGGAPDIVSEAIDMTTYQDLIIELLMSGPSTDVDLVFREAVNNSVATYTRDDSAGTAAVLEQTAGSPAGGAYDRTYIFRNLGGKTYEIFLGNDDAVNEATIDACVATRFNQRHI